jgi:hypothetical protein
MFNDYAIAAIDGRLADRHICSIESRLKFESSGFSPNRNILDEWRRSVLKINTTNEEFY